MVMCFMNERECLCFTILFTFWFVQTRACFQVCGVSGVRRIATCVDSECLIMEETQKPFVCKADGCDMSFTNEDHLVVHTKKHTMSLTLGLSSKAASFVGE